MKYVLLLFLSIFLEICGTLTMKISTDQLAIHPEILMCIFIALAFIIFSFVIKKIPLGIAYALWEGIGLLSIVILDIYIFHTHLENREILGLFILLIGILLISNGKKSNIEIKNIPLPSTGKA